MKTSKISELHPPYIQESSRSAAAAAWEAGAEDEIEDTMSISQLCLRPKSGAADLGIAL